jgi:cytosine deaminase
VTVMNQPELVAMMAAFIEDNPTLWNEDIGVD